MPFYGPRALNRMKERRKGAEFQHPSLLLPDRDAVWPAASHSGIHTVPVITDSPMSQNKPPSSIHCIC